MKTELPTYFDERFRTKSLTKSALTLALHQFIGMYGISFTAPVVLSLGFKVLYLFGRHYSTRDFHSILSETPYFPVQIAFALVLGWLLGRSLRDRSMLWVWILPLAILCFAFVTTPMEQTSVLAKQFLGQTRLSHFFGWGCRPAAHCLDQLVVTLPFYSSLAYSMGAFLARKTFHPGYAAAQELFLAVMAAGLIIILATGIDLVISIRQTGWQRTYWFVLATPFGVGAYVLYVASTIRRQRIPNRSTPD